DVLVAAGVYDVIQHAAAKFQREVCQQRARSRSSTPEENTSSAGSATPRASSAPHISKSNGITRPLEATAANQRARRMLQRGSSSSTRSTRKSGTAGQSAQLAASR